MDRNTSPREGVEHPDHRVEFRLSSADIEAVRFGISPGHELAHAVRALLAPARFPLQWGWLRDVQSRVPRDAFGLLAQVIGGDGYLPDFLTADPRWDRTPASELEALRAAPVAGMRVDLEKMIARSAGERQALLRGLHDRPVEARARIADAWEAVWDVALAPYWTHLEGIARADIVVRSRVIAVEGLAAMAGGLHRDVSWHDGAVRVRLRRHSEDVDCRGVGLVLVPSVMSSWRCMVITEAPAQPTLFYPARGVTEAWSRDIADTQEALEALLGPARASTLLRSHSARTTTQVAADTDLAVSTASHHLSVLRRAGLVTSTREGNRVVHVRTPLGEALVRSGA